MAEHTSIDEVWFVVSPQNPFKPIDSLVEDYHRFKMVEIAIENHPKLKVSNIEFDLPKPSYTVDTLEHLRKKYPDYEFKIIMGSDLLCCFDKWKNPEHILQHHEILVYPRANGEPDKFKNHPKIKFINAPLIEISSTEIRNDISEKKDVRKLLPEKVYNYITKLGFYVK